VSYRPGPYKNVKTLIVSSLPKFDGAPRNFSPPRPKTHISPLQSGVRATNAYRSVLIHHRKRSCLNRALLNSGDTWMRWATDALLRRGHRLSHTVPFSAITTQDARPGFCVSSLIAFSWKGNTSVTKQGSFPAFSACPSLHQSLLGSPLPSHTWSSSNIKCLHAFHLSSYGDLAQWDTQLQSSWCWREVLHRPRILERALPTLQLPTDLAVPLLPGLAWHLAAPAFSRPPPKLRRSSMSPRPRLLQASLSRFYTVTGISPLQFPRLLDPPYHFAIPPLSGRRTWVPP